jgi:AbrB family looped-hinge helix DNA binding protein
MEATSVTSKGQVTIPKAVRQRLGIRQGSRIEFEVAGDHAVLRVANAQAAAVPSGFGLLKSKRKPVPADADPAQWARRP